jgi:signal peptidase I
MFTIALLVATLITSFLAGALFLWFAARVSSVPQAGFLRALLVMLILTFLSVLDLGISALSPWPLFPLVFELMIILPVNWLLLAVLFRISFPRAMLVSVIWIACGLAFSIALFISAKAFVLEAYTQPANGMAPTILGLHHQGICPHCAGALAVPPPDRPGFLPQDGAFLPEDAGFPPQEQEAICSKCLKMSKVMKWDPGILLPDRFICNKLLSLRRWDLIVFRYPRDPKEKYIKRLVGLPGEEIVIKEGAIWINGVRMEPPAEIAGLVFTDGVDGMKGWGAPDDPARLGPDEYYVLGDFANRSSDSRHWKAVPGSHIEGVVTLIYWPPNRWRIFR